MNINRKLLLLASAALCCTAATAFYLLRSESPVHNTLNRKIQQVISKSSAPRPTELAWEVAFNSYAKRFQLNLTQEDSFDDPFGIAIDAEGNVIVIDAGDKNRLLRIRKSGEVETLAGSTEGFADSIEGAADAAKFHTPSGIAIDQQGNIYVADTGNHVIRKISKQGKVSTLAGSGYAGFRDDVGLAAQFNGPIGVAVDKSGNVYVADTYNDKIRVIDSKGSVSTLAGGNATGYRDGVGTEALFDTPSNLVINSKGELLVADTRNNAIRKISTAPEDRGTVSTIAMSEPKDSDALLRRPVGLAITHDDFLYVGELSHGRILQIAPNGEMRGLTGVDIDIIPGDDTSPRIQHPVGIAVTRQGNLLITDTGKRKIHLLTHKATPETSLSLVKPTPDATTPTAVAPANFPWPLLPQDQPHEVVGTIGEVRGNYDGESRDHFHRGVDMQAAMGDTVVVIKDEKISSPTPTWAASTINEGMRINQFSYIHMKVGRKQNDSAFNAEKFQFIKGENGKLQQVRVKRGTRFHVGEAIGSVNSMYHVHINYAPEGDVVNPLLLRFVGFQDSVTPIINRIQIADKGERILSNAVAPANKAKGKKTATKAPEPKANSPLLIKRSLEQVSIIVDAFDQADGNADRRRLGLYELGYQILHGDGTPLTGYEQMKMTIRFNRLPPDEEAVKVAYAENSGITVHGNASTKFLYNLTNEIHDGHAIVNFWNIKDLPAGDYVIRVHAADFAGNVAKGNSELRVRLE